MEQLILVAHVLIAVAIIGLILIQQGKGADMGASFGAGASQTLFGSRGSGNVLTKSTAILATLFFVTSFTLAVLARNHAKSVGDVSVPVPAVKETSQQTVDDIPAVEDNSASATSDDIPSAPAESDIPSVPEN